MTTIDKGGESDPLRDYFEEVFPGAFATEATEPADLIANLARCGFGLAEVILPDGTMAYATFVKEETPYLEAIKQIHAGEVVGEYPEGTHVAAMDAIGEGSFDIQWGHLLLNNDF